GVMALHGIDLYDLSAPYLEQLADLTGETANLGVPIAGDQVVYIRQVLSRHSIRHAAWIGRTVPMEGTAIGAAVSGRFGRNGVSLARVTIEPDVTALAAPVFGADDLIVGALSVTGPSYRMDDVLIERAKIALLRAAQTSVAAGAGGSQVLLDDDDLPMESDGVHLTNAGQLVLGERLWAIDQGVRRGIRRTPEGRRSILPRADRRAFGETRQGG
ncbi:IclR family transcriptional regulator domain-containing protein, partial [Sphingomonas bacterium]|uniref:IclR family transcriptional regulator domain-containing protein n=1 Tax=Sphingomonas bacterium TaxID=1895847 RepID=UPI00266EA0AB